MIQARPSMEARTSRGLSAPRARIVLVATVEVCVVGSYKTCIRMLNSKQRTASPPKRTTTAKRAAKAPIRAIPRASWVSCSCFGWHTWSSTPCHPSVFMSNVRFTTHYILIRRCVCLEWVYLLDFRSKPRCIWRWRVLR